jgi:hypothetical protein
MAELTPDRRPEEAGDFDTMDLLEAVDHLDQIRYRVADQEKLRPPEVREQLMELHQLIFGLMREGRTIPDELQVWGPHRRDPGYRLADRGSRQLVQRLQVDAPCHRCPSGHPRGTGQTLLYLYP